MVKWGSSLKQEYSTGIANALNINLRNDTMSSSINLFTLKSPCSFSLKLHKNMACSLISVNVGKYPDKQSEAPKLTEDRSDSGENLNWQCFERKVGVIAKIVLNWKKNY